MPNIWFWIISIVGIVEFFCGMYAQRKIQEREFRKKYLEPAMKQHAAEIAALYSKPPA